MEGQFDKLINFWAVVTMVALIVSAIGLFLFRYYSGKKTKEEFRNVKTKIVDEVDKSIIEISNTKEFINNKLQSEASQIITKLKNKADETSSALEEIIVESTIASQKIKEDLAAFKSKAESEIQKISRPLGNSFFVNGFSYTFTVDKFPILHKEFKSSKNHLDFIQDINIKNFSRVSSGITDPKLPKDIVNTLLTKMTGVSLLVVDNISDDIKDVNKILSIGFTLKDVTNIQTSYCIERNLKNEFYSITLNNDKKSSTGVHKYKNTYSKDDICGKFVLAQTTINNTIPRNEYPYNMKLSNFRIRDEFNNDFDFVPIKNISLKNGDSPIKEFRDLETRYTLGVLKCTN